MCHQVVFQEPHAGHNLQEPVLTYVLAWDQISKAGARNLASPPHATLNH